MKKIPEWKKKQNELRMRARERKYLWISRDHAGNRFTYERKRHGELKHA